MVPVLCLLAVATATARPASAETPAPSYFQILANEPDRITVGGGVVDILEEGRNKTGHRGAGLLEYRSGHKLLFAGPLLGILADHDGGVFGYGGLFFDVGFGSWRFSPLLSAGGYRRGDSKDLGGVFQFQLGGTLSYEFSSGLRAGIYAAHISNRNLHYENPGEELLMITLAFSLG